MNAEIILRLMALSSTSRKLTCLLGVSKDSKGSVRSEVPGCGVDKTLLGNDIF